MESSLLPFEVVQLYMLIISHILYPSRVGPQQGAFCPPSLTAIEQGHIWFRNKEKLYYFFQRMKRCHSHSTAWASSDCSCWQGCFIGTLWDGAKFSWVGHSCAAQDFPGGPVIKNLSANAGVQFLSREDPLVKEMATKFSIPAWESPWTEEPTGLQSIGSQRVPHSFDWVSTQGLLTLQTTVQAQHLCMLPPSWICTWPQSWDVRSSSFSWDTLVWRTGQVQGLFA